MASTIGCHESAPEKAASIGESIGKAATGLGKGIGKGIDEKLHVTIEIAPALQERGVSATVAKQVLDSKAEATGNSVNPRFAMMPPRD